jgi:hypothetical protein
MIFCTFVRLELFRLLFSFLFFCFFVFFFFDSSFFLFKVVAHLQPSIDADGIEALTQSCFNVLKSSMLEPQSEQTAVMVNFLLSPCFLSFSLFLIPKYILQTLIGCEGDRAEEAMNGWHKVEIDGVLAGSLL